MVIAALDQDIVLAVFLPGNTECINNMRHAIYYNYYRQEVCCEFKQKAHQETDASLGDCRTGIAGTFCTGHYCDVLTGGCQVSER